MELAVRCSTVGDLERDGRERASRHNGTPSSMGQSLEMLVQFGLAINRHIGVHQGPGFRSCAPARRPQKIKAGFPWETGLGLGDKP